MVPQNRPRPLPYTSSALYYLIISLVHCTGDTTNSVGDESEFDGRLSAVIIIIIMQSRRLRTKVSVKLKVLACPPSPPGGLSDGFF
jgi:hypothetical protein